MRNIKKGKSIIIKKRNIKVNLKSMGIVINMLIKMYMEREKKIKIVKVREVNKKKWRRNWKMIKWEKVWN